MHNFPQDAPRTTRSMSGILLQEGGLVDVAIVNNFGLLKSVRDCERPPAQSDVFETWPPVSITLLNREYCPVWWLNCVTFPREAEYFVAGDLASGRVCTILPVMHIRR
jgi:hypothetical protein